MSNETPPVPASPNPPTDVTLPAYDHVNYSGAGVLLYAYKELNDGSNRAYLLLRKKLRNTLNCADFGGSRAKGERHPVLTAAREFNEESLGAIFTLDEITQKILEKTLFIYEANYYQYWVEIPFDDQILVNFAKARSDKLPTASNDELEKLQLRWFAVENIRKSTQEVKQRQFDSQNSKKNTNPFKKPLLCEECALRNHVIKTLSKAEELGLLEKLEKCNLPRK